MLKTAKSIATSQLARGSFVMFVGFMLTNFSNYIYTVVMGRLLGPLEYGVLTALVSLFYIISVPTLTINTVTVKFFANLQAKKDYPKLHALFSFLTQWLFLLCSLIIFLMVVLSIHIAKFMNIKEALPIVILGGILGASFLITLNNSVLQALLRFKLLSAFSVLGALLKLIFGVIFVYAGYKASGALAGILLSTVIVYLITFYPLRFLFSYRGVSSKIEKSPLFNFALPAFVSVLGLTLMNNLDVILVKRFFSPEDAGLYASLSLIGKLIFFVVGSVVGVMYPLVAQRLSSKGDHVKPFVYSLVLVVLFCFVSTLMYFAFPTLIVNLIFGQRYLMITKYLGPFAIFVSLFSISTLFVNLYLLTDRVKAITLPLIFSLIQAGLLFKVHNSFEEVIVVNSTVAFLMLSSLVVYYVLSSRHSSIVLNNE